MGRVSERASLLCDPQVCTPHSLTLGAHGGIHATSSQLFTEARLISSLMLGTSCLI